MENDEEIKRLELKTDAAVVEAYALRAGLEQGMRAADVFCGTGRTSSVLGRLVGNEGSVVGFDASDERIRFAREHYASETVRFVAADATEPFQEQGTFDFVWIRFALEYFRKESFDIVKNASRLLKPGGILCLIDLDHNCLNHYGIEPRLEAALTDAIRQIEEKTNFDPYMGRKLYSYLYRLGYEGIRAEAGAHHLIYGELGEVDRYNWVQKIKTITKNPDIAISGYASVEDFLSEFVRFFSDPGRFTYTPVIACSGRKPSGPEPHHA